MEHVSHEVRVRTDYMNLKYHYSILILGGGGEGGRAFLENPVVFFDLGPGKLSARWAPVIDEMCWVSMQSE